jgi:desulfoferrodoxin (superoxide reductase-like protein)
MNEASEAEKKSKENTEFSITIFVDSVANSMSPAHHIAVFSWTALLLCCADSR